MPGRGGCVFAVGRRMGVCHRDVRQRAVCERGGPVHERAQARIGEREAPTHKVQVLRNGADEDVFHLKTSCIEENFCSVDDGDCG